MEKAGIAMKYFWVLQTLETPLLEQKDFYKNKEGRCGCIQDKPLLESERWIQVLIFYTFPDFSEPQCLHLWNENVRLACPSGTF